MSYRLERPDVDADDDALVFSRDGELCTVGSDHFILANLELPYRSGEKFVFTCWVSLSEESFRRMNECWERVGRENEEPMFAWFCNSLPTYEPTTMLLKSRVHMHPIGERPWIELEPTDHPLAIEQRTAVGDRRIFALYHAFIGSSPN